MSMITLEYVWIDGENNLRSKVRVIDRLHFDIDNIPDWNFDGSSTCQAKGNDSEIILKPCANFNTNYHSGISDFEYMNHILVMCETYTPNGIPCPNNHRVYANRVFNQALDEEPWFGLEQEYFIIDTKTNKPLGFPLDDGDAKQGQYYCSVGSNNAYGRKIAEEHLLSCIQADIKISGINAEVAPGQWEFQIGPCVGVSQGDHLWMARFLLHKIAEKYNVLIDFHPKPLDGDWNGSGCHANYSTKNMRLGTSDKTGLEYIDNAIRKLESNHLEHMEVYGNDNHLRMSGEHETSSYHVFSDGVANRGASVRRGHDTIKNKRGYFEDRRPSSNCDPYLVTGKIFETTILS
uniref:glutamine synthetase n=1 Tax=viral metagenome TaxID=1070528 RepID=A0A6C0LWW8_9ZZZZ